MIEIKWTEPALADLRAIRDYIARDSAYYAEKVVDEAFDKIDNLAQWPNMGRQVPEEGDPSIREVYITPTGSFTRLFRIVSAFLPSFTANNNTVHRKAQTECLRL